MKYIRTFAWVFVGGSLAWSVNGCASLSGPRVRESVGGEYVVEVKGGMSPEDIARKVYGDPGLAPEVAALANVSPGDDVPSGTLLVLPRRQDLEERVAVEHQAEALYRNGLEAADDGSFRVAADYFREALRLKPQRTDILHNLGLALVRAGELEEATQVLEESAQRRPDDAETRYALGSVLRKRGAYERALGEFEAVEKLDSHHTSAAFAQARTLEDMGRLEEAERAYDEFVRRFPKDPWAPRAQESLDALRNPEEGPDELGDPAGSVRPEQMQYTLDPSTGS